MKKYIKRSNNPLKPQDYPRQKGGTAVQYITGIFALNIRTMPDVCGDWHRGALDWNKVCLQESGQSVWGNYGIAKDHFVPELGRKCNVANTVRALLDLIAAKQFHYAQGMQSDFVCNDDYTTEIFDKVLMLKNRPDWSEIDSFMQSEYKMKWVRYAGSEASAPKTIAVPNRKQHTETMRSFLQFLGSQCKGGEYTLKGGAALMLYYGSDRLPDRLDFDQCEKSGDLIPIVEQFCKANGYALQIAETTPAVQRCTVSYGAERPEAALTIKVSRRTWAVDPSLCESKDGARVYKIDTLALLINNDFQSRTRLCDLFDLCFICMHCFQLLSGNTKEAIAGALAYRGLDYADWVIHTQSDPSIDSEKLMTGVRKAFEVCGLPFRESSPDES